LSVRYAVPESFCGFRPHDEIAKATDRSSTLLTKDADAAFCTDRAAQVERGMKRLVAGLGIERVTPHELSEPV
jgi:hypothetical protein